MALCQAPILGCLPCIAGPFFVFLVGRAREWAIGTTLDAVGLSGNGDT